MLPDILFTLFLIHVGNLTSVKNSRRRFAPTPAHITGIRSKRHVADKELFVQCCLPNSDSSDCSSFANVSVTPNALTRKDLESFGLEFDATGYSCLPAHDP
jgi:hypothetical protein